MTQLIISKELKNSAGKMAQLGKHLSPKHEDLTLNTRAHVSKGC